MESLCNEAWAKDSGGHHRRFVAYYRVSTGRQASSGLGLDAQHTAICEFLSAYDGYLIAEFSETVSGRRDNRPQLNNALALCRIARATLVIARLDRLSRSVGMISRLMESGVDFVTTDFPFANRFTIHVLAAVANTNPVCNRNEPRRQWRGLESAASNWESRSERYSVAFLLAANNSARWRGGIAAKPAPGTSRRSFGD